MSMKSFLSGVALVGGYLALSSAMSSHDDAIMKASLDSNISAAIKQCLPEEVNEVCTIKLIKESGRLKLVTERHTLKSYGQPVPQPSMKFVIAMGDQK